MAAATCCPMRSHGALSALATMCDGFLWLFIGCVCWLHLLWPGPQVNCMHH